MWNETISKLSEQDRNWYILKGYDIEENRHRRAFLFDGVLHREDEPAIEWANGALSWYLNGIWMFEEEHQKAISGNMKNVT